MGRRPSLALRVLLREDSSAPSGREEKKKEWVPRVPRRSGQRRCTRGYSPSPRWGVQGRRSGQDGVLRPAVGEHARGKGAVVGGVCGDGGGVGLHCARKTGPDRAKGSSLG
jgi:hypothetical protein